MYVSRGIGTSFLPFRLGVKPEITFFIFSNNPGNPTNSFDSFLISNTPPTTFFLGLSISNIFETFNLFDKIRNIFTSRDSVNSNELFDFESEEELKRLNWECHKWFQLSERNATSGKYSLKAILPPGQFPGINFEEIRNDWSKWNLLKLDVYNPSKEEFNFHIRIDDQKSSLEYTDRFDIDFNLKQGMNHIAIPTDSIRTNIHHHPLNLKRIKRMMVFLTNNTAPRELYFDHIRLE
jgi:hypothetical protein